MKILLYECCNVLRSTWFHIKSDVLYKVSKLSLPYASQTPNLCVTCQGIKTFTDLINGCYNQCVVCNGLQSYDQIKLHPVLELDQTSSSPRTWSNLHPVLGLDKTSSSPSTWSKLHPIPGLDQTSSSPSTWSKLHPVLVLDQNFIQS
jgi:hypothetical protein